MNTQTKQQTRKVGVAGSFNNQIMGNNRSEPVVGKGATILFYSDRAAYEVIEVSEDGMSCIIRKMNCKNVGKCYGDEQYEYKSDLDGVQLNLEWNVKKGCWGQVWYEIDIIKALRNKYEKEYGYGYMNILLKDHGLNSYDELYEDPEADNFQHPKKLIKGLTKEYKNFSKVSIIFGIMEEYRDPHF